MSPSGIPSSIREPVAKTRLRLWLRFLQSARSIENELRENFRAEFASTLPRFDVMAALSRFRDGLKMSALSAELRVSNGNVTGIVDRLVEDGLLIRLAVPSDRRASLVRLTRKGQQEFKRQALAHERWVNDILRVFSQQDAAELALRLDVFSRRSDN